MNNFKQFNIQEEQSEGFIGNKIKMSKILDREIIVHHYKIEDSKIFANKGTGKCLYMQITFNNDKHVIFTSASKLMNDIQQIPKDGFPFITTIIEKDERFIFT